MAEQLKAKRKAKPKPTVQPDSFLVENDKPKPDSARIHCLRSGLQFDSEKYEYKDDFVAADTSNPLEVHTTAEMIECALKNPDIEIEARVLGYSGQGRGIVKMDRAAFLESAKKRDSKRLREAYDGFAMDDAPTTGMIGDDFTPLLGGPFNKQLYYRDYLRMISACFYAFHHDPVARDVVSIITDFTIGRGFRLHTTGKDADKAQLMWDAFVKANDLNQQFDWAASELSIYGEVMWWKLPHQQTRISFNPMQGEKVPVGLIPRVRLIDPSNIAEIVTVPEDILKGVLYYVWLAPTQYQMWTDGKQPSTKFVYTQIPADQVMHFKINSVSNEKRGRSDYFPALGYMKRLRDSVNYSLVAQMKSAAWSLDTVIKGDDSDVDAYVTAQNAMGTIPPAGSEFVHTEAITRQYLSNSATGKSSDSPTFSWCMNMVCMATGIPLSYFGTHLSGAGTRANALVSTEPVAKRFERRRGVYERMVRTMFDDLMRQFGLNADCELVFPELITQDRSAYLRDLGTAQSQGWISKETAANKAAKEFDLNDYDFDQEQAKMEKDPVVPETKPTSTNPLTTPGKQPQTQKSNGTLAAPERTTLKNNMRTL